MREGPRRDWLEAWRGSPLARATVAGWSAWVSIILLGMVRTKVNAVTLGSAGVGIIGQANYLATWIGGIATLGLGTGCIRAMATARARGDEGELRAVAHLVVLLPFALSMVLAVPVIVFSRQAAVSLAQDPAVAWMVALAALSVPLNMLAGGISAVLQGEEQIARNAWVTTISAVLNTALVVGLVLGMNLAGAAIAILLTSVVGIAVSVTAAPGAAGKALGLPLRLPGRGALAAIMKLSLASFLLGVAGTSADLVIRARVVGMLGVRSVGEYQPVYAISNLYLAGFIGAIGVYLFPTLTRMVESGDHAGAEKELAAGLRMMLLVFTPLIVLLAMAAPLVVRLLYSREFDAAGPILRIQLAGEVFKVCAYSLGAVLLPLRLTRWWAAIGLCTVAVNIGLAWFLLPALRLPALGLAYSVSWAVNLGATLAVVLRVRGAWLSPRGALLVGASIVSVSGVVAATLVAPRVVWLSAGIAVGAAWASGALAALLRRR